MAKNSSKLAPSFVRVFLPAFALLLLMALAWVFASPIYSSPDETAHGAKAIAVVRGELTGHRVVGVRHLVVDLPASYSFKPEIICFVQDSKRAANCPASLGDPGGTPWFGDWVATYNPTYYALVGWPSLLFGGDAGIYAMRAVSAAIGAALLAWALQLGLAARRSRWMPAGMAFFASPMILYMSASINPQGIEIAAAACLWVALIRLLESYDDARRPTLPRWYLWLAVTVSSALLATARSLGPLWLVVIVISAFAIVGFKSARPLFTARSSYPWLVGIAVAGLFSIAWTLGAGTLSGQAASTDGPLVNGTFLQGAWAVLRNTPAYLDQAAGVFGWLDTGLPSIAYALNFSAVLLLVVLAGLGTTRRALMVVAGLLALSLFTPPVLQGLSVAQTGIIWQGRYAIAIYLGVVIAAAWFLSQRGGSRLGYLSVRITATIATLLAAFELMAFVIVLWRYVVGTGAPITTMISAPQWQPPFGWPAVLTLAAVGIVGFAVWITRQAAVAARNDLVVESRN